MVQENKAMDRTSGMFFKLKAEEEVGRSNRKNLRLVWDGYVKGRAKRISGNRGMRRKTQGVIRKRRSRGNSL